MTQTVHLTMTGGFSDEVAFAVQSDKLLPSLRCILKGYRYEPGDTALFRATKPDGNVCYISGITEGGNVFRITVTEQLTTVPGDVKCDLCIYRGTGMISSDEFLLKVRPPSAAGAMTESESEYLGFPDLILYTINPQPITTGEIDTIWEEVLNGLSG